MRKIILFLIIMFGVINAQNVPSYNHDSGTRSSLWKVGIRGGAFRWSGDSLVYKVLWNNITGSTFADSGYVVMTENGGGNHIPQTINGRKRFKTWTTLDTMRTFFLRVGVTADSIKTNAGTGDLMLESSGTPNNFSHWVYYGDNGLAGRTLDTLASLRKMRTGGKTKWLVGGGVYSLPYQKKADSTLFFTPSIADTNKFLQYYSGGWRLATAGAGSSIDTTKISYLAKTETFTGAKTFNGDLIFGASADLTLPTADPTPDVGKFWRSTDVLKYTNSVGDAKTLTFGTGTANELTYWSSANSLGTLPVATYPSLTEMSYVKGLSSAVQTQLNGKLTSTLTNTYLFVGNISNVATGVAMSGDATIANTGVVTVADDSHAHTGSTISGLAVADFTSPNISNWTNDSGYLTASTGVTLGTNQAITGGKSFASYLNFTSTGTLSLPTLATITKGDLWYKEDATYTVGEYRGYNVNGAFSLIRDNGTYSNPPWVASLSENKISFTDITTGNASTSAHGYLPKLNNSATQFLNGQGAWATPATTVDQTASYSWTGLHKFTSALLSVDTTGAYFNSYTATSGADIKGLTSYVYTSSNPTANKIYGGLFNATGSGISGGSQSYGIYATATGSNDNYAGYFDATTNNAYAGYFNNGLVYIKDNLQVGAGKFIVSTTGTLIKINNTLASDVSNYVLMSDGTSYTPVNFLDRNNTWTGSTTYTPEGITYATTIDAANKTCISAGGSGNGTTTTISNGINGQILILINTSSSFTWTLNETGNINLAGTADYVMGQSDTITLIYESGSAKWLETARSNN